MNRLYTQWIRRMSSEEWPEPLYIQAERQYIIVCYLGRNLEILFCFFLFFLVSTIFRKYKGTAWESQVWALLFLSSSIMYPEAETQASEMPLGDKQILQMCWGQGIRRCC